MPSRCLQSHHEVGATAGWQCVYCQLRSAHQDGIRSRYILDCISTCHYEQAAAARKFGVAIADESHYLKDGATQRVKVTASINKKCSLADAFLRPFCHCSKPRSARFSSPALPPSPGLASCSTRPVQKAYFRHSRFTLPQLNALSPELFKLVMVLDLSENIISLCRTMMSFGKRYCAAFEGRFGWDFSGFVFVSEKTLLNLRLTDRPTWRSSMHCYATRCSFAGSKRMC